jgi:hypothetical protein
MFTTVTTKSFEVLGWNQESCLCSSQNAVPHNYYTTLLSFWIHCLAFHKHEQDMIFLSAALYPYTDVPYEQKSSVIRFTLSAGTYFQTIWSEKTDKQTMQAIQTFFSRYIEVLSLCLGGLPNLSIPHSLDSGTVEKALVVVRLYCCI